MSDAKIFAEGGGDSKELISRCREGFHKLLENSGFAGRQPRIIPCGSRDNAYDNFKTAYEQGKTTYVALLVDSEDPVADLNKPWEHLHNRDNKWGRPKDAKGDEATDDQVFLMTTCMETWIVADRDGLKRYFDPLNKELIRLNSLPSTANLETKQRHDILNALEIATKDCSNCYMKNKRSFKALANADPVILRKLLPAFDRMLRILNEKL